jgi:hypothetical protein
MNTTSNPKSTWDDPNLAHVSGFRTATDNLPYEISAEEIRGKTPEGFVLCVIYDASTELSELMLLDAASMVDEITVVPLKTIQLTAFTVATPRCKILHNLNRN